jgi:hypothetical protein
MSGGLFCFYVKVYDKSQYRNSYLNYLCILLTSNINL